MPWAIQVNHRYVKMSNGFHRPKLVDDVRLASIYEDEKRAKSRVDSLRWAPLGGIPVAVEVDVVVKIERRLSSEEVDRLWEDQHGYSDARAIAVRVLTCETMRDGSRNPWFKEDVLQNIAKKESGESKTLESEVDRIAKAILSGEFKFGKLADGSDNLPIRVDGAFIGRRNDLPKKDRSVSVPKIVMTRERRLNRVMRKTPCR
jgi:hypothetical protein